MARRGSSAPSAPTQPGKGPSALEFRFAGLPDRHGYFAQALAYSFRDLRVAAALEDNAGEWHAINDVIGVAQFEYAHGHALERGEYNGRCLQRAREERKAVRGEHLGFSDYYVPLVGRDGRVDAVLVTGTFATSRPSSMEVLERWRWLTGRQGHPSDAEFAKYLALTLDSLTLVGDKLDCFERWLACWASLVAGRGKARALATEAAALKVKLDEARFVDRTWETARSMVDEGRRGAWYSPQLSDDLLRVGLDRPPEHALVGLLARPGAGTDPVADLLARDAFQRACAELTRGTDCVCGRVGEQGVVFLVSRHASGASLERSLRDLGQRAAALARAHFGLKLHLGMSSPTGARHLGERYEQALGAAELALSKGLSWARTDATARRVLASARELRRDLRTAAREQPKTLVSRFERYIGTVASSSNQRMDVARALLDAGFEQAAQSLLESGALSEASYRDACQALDRAARETTTFVELCSAYRRSVADLVALLERPVESAQDGGLSRALTFLGEHVTESLSLSSVARVAGFAPSYFSTLFKRRQGTTFERYVQRLRIERAKELLAGTDLSVTRVAELCGFRVRHHFHRVFKQLVGTTPGSYQRSRTTSRRRPAPRSKRRG